MTTFKVKINKNFILKNLPKEINFYMEKNTRKNAGKGYKTVQGLQAKRLSRKQSKISNAEVFKINNERYKYIEKYVIPQINDFYAIVLNTKLNNEQQNNTLIEAFTRPIRTGKLGRGFFNNTVYKVAGVYTGQMLDNIRAFKVLRDEQL